jgi:2-oxoglutarate dehydrogenase E2 component (dihydrolipoamide succinyltransferase)
MAIVEMIMPRMGESIMEATVLAWLKNLGEKIELDDYLLEVATDKIDTEVPATMSGVLKEILVQVGEVAVIGKPICLIEIEAENNVSSEKIAEKLEENFAEIETLTGIKINPNSETISSKTDDKSNRFYSPLVLNICKEEGISKEELDKVFGSGAVGRVTKNDILAYLENRKQPQSIGSILSQIPVLQNVSTPKALNAGDEIIEMDRMRKMIATRMVDSKRIAPHVTSFVETDMTNIVKWRENIKATYQKQYGENITFTPILIDAVVRAIKDFPMINSSLSGDTITVKKSINIGMAVALPNGNLIVPVIHNADQYNLVGLTKKVNDLSKRARENKLKADDLEGGTYTISNIGTFGNIMGTPIILQPQVAIMAFGAIQKKVSVIETPAGDLIGIRNKMFVSHSYDHRIIDGSLGGQFVKRVSDYLEAFDIDMKVL